MTRPMQYRTFAGVILAGGNGNRLGGIPKGTLRFLNGVSIVEHLIAEFAHAGIEHTIIVANDPGPYRHYRAKILRDARAHHGPLGGIEAALDYLDEQHHAVICLPCDVPHVTAGEILALKAALCSVTAPVVYARTPCRTHTVCASLRAGLRDNISTALNQGRRCVFRLWQALGAQPLCFPDETAFLNVNTAADLIRWRDLQNAKPEQTHVSGGDALACG